MTRTSTTINPSKTKVTSKIPVGKADSKLPINQTKKEKNMDSDTKALLEQLNVLTKTELSAATIIAECKKQRSDMLGALVAKVGKNFTRKGVVYTICKRGDTYFTKSAGNGVVNLDD